MFKKKLRCRRIIFCLSLLTMCLVLGSGCGQKRDKNGSAISDDGRSYGGEIHAGMKETVSTAFFDMTVDKVEKYNTFQFGDGLYQADSGMAYLSVTLTIKNTYDENLSMSITDFTLDYDGRQSEDILTGYGNNDLQQEDYMDNLFTLKKGESITKSILFTVADKDAYILSYREYYEDKFEGDLFKIELLPEAQETGNIYEKAE